MEHFDFRSHGLTLTRGIKSNDRYLVARTQSVDKRIRRLTYESNILARGTRSIQEKRDFKWRFRGCEVCDLLLLTVLEKQKIFGPQSG